MPEESEKAKPSKKQIVDPAEEKGEVTTAIDRAVHAEVRAALAEEKAKEDYKVFQERWKTYREFLTGPNLKWIAATIIILALVVSSMLSGVGFTITQGGVKFGAGGDPPDGSMDAIQTPPE